MPNAPAMPAPARKKDLLFNERIPYPLEESHNFTKKGLPCPKEACHESSRSLTRPHRCYLSGKSRARWIFAHPAFSVSVLEPVRRRPPLDRNSAEAATRYSEAARTARAASDALMHYQVSFFPHHTYSRPRRRSPLPPS